MKNYFLIFISLLSILLSEDSSKEIQENIDEKESKADAINLEIEELKNKILNTKNQSEQSINKLSDIEVKLRMIQNLIELMKNEEINLDKSISETGTKLNEKQAELNLLKDKFTAMILHLYRNKSDRYLDMLLDSDDWNDLAFKIKYLEILTTEQDKIKTKIDEIVIFLNEDISSFTTELLNIRVSESKQKSKVLGLNDQKEDEKEKLKIIKSEKYRLEKSKSQKQAALLDLNETIKELIENKKIAEKREKKLDRIRAERERNKLDSLSRIENFSKLKGNLPWPVEGVIITKFGEDEVNGVKTNNLGIEIKTKINAEVKSIHDGIVVEIDFNPYFGSFVIIDHGKGFSTLYAHLKDDRILVKKDQYIDRNQIIGYALNINKNNDTFGMINFMIFKNEKDKNGNYKSINKDPEDWIK